MTHVTDVETGAYEIGNVLKLKVGQGLEASWMLASGQGIEDADVTVEELTVQKTGRICKRVTTAAYWVPWEHQAQLGPRGECDWPLCAAGEALSGKVTLVPGFKGGDRVSHE